MTTAQCSPIKLGHISYNCLHFVLIDSTVIGSTKTLLPDDRIKFSAPEQLSTICDSLASRPTFARTLTIRIAGLSLCENIIYRTADAHCCIIGAATVLLSC